MTFPMFIFTIYLGIWLSDYLEKHNGIKEIQKCSGCYNISGSIVAPFVIILCIKQEL